jgi:hypothetical protein
VTEANCCVLDSKLLGNFRLGRLGTASAVFALFFITFAAYNNYKCL